MTKTTPPAAPVADEHAGLGGSYVIDEATGKRTLVERTQDAKPKDKPHYAPAAAPAEAKE